jgi:hypothetical protein
MLLPSGVNPHLESLAALPGLIEPTITEVVQEPVECRSQSLHNADPIGIRRLDTILDNMRSTAGTHRDQVPMKLALAGVYPDGKANRVRRHDALAEHSRTIRHRLGIQWRELHVWSNPRQRPDELSHFFLGPVSIIRPSCPPFVGRQLPYSYEWVVDR